jgi:hypothetical protein
MDGSDQLGSAVTTGIVLAVGLMLFLLLAWLARAVWRWVTGGGSNPKAQRKELKLELGRSLGEVGVSASDLFVIRSNLNAVARQVEDLERRLRLETSSRAKNLTAPWE